MAKEAAPEAKTEQTAKAKDHEEAAPTIASLTEDQIQSVGVTTGPIEMKELTATVKPMVCFVFPITIKQL